MLKCLTATVYGVPIRTLVSIYVLWYLLNLVQELTEVPKVRLLERAVCESHYRSIAPHAIPETQCKIVPIQNEVIFIMGWQLSLESIPGVLTAAAYATVADRFGRRLTLLLACLGEFVAMLFIILVCYFNNFLPVRLALASSLFLLIGGGRRISGSMVLTVLADITQYVNRTRLFYLIGVFESLANITAPPLVALTLAQSVWLPFYISGAIYLAMPLLVWILPDTRSRKAIYGNVDGYSTQSLLVPEENLITSQSNDNSQSQAEPSNERGSWIEALRLFKSRNLFILLLVTFLKRVAFLSEFFFAQYASERFHLDYSETPWFSWAQSLGAVLSMGIMVPTLILYLRRWRVMPRYIDLSMIIMNFVILIAGFCLVWKAPVPLLLAAATFLCGFGEGVEPAIQGLASSFVEAAKNAKLFTTLMLIELIGRIVGGAIMGYLFRRGRDSRGSPNGLPFLASSIIFTGGLLLLYFLRIGGSWTAYEGEVESQPATLNAELDTE